MFSTDVPVLGPLTIGAVYQRAALHARFGGNQTAGIVPSTSEPVVLLFHTEEGAQQFYGDGLDDDGVYWYSGMGASGDMEWNYANRAVRDHATDGRDLYLFERFQRQGGFWSLSHQVYCLGYKEEQRPDRDGRMRRAIIFGLLPIGETVAPESVAADLDSLRRAATTAAPKDVATTVRIRDVYLRSAAVKQYALARADGACEACGVAAPFMLPSGQPFLEVHHLDRLADGGPDRPDRVAGVCPNCHRRCHYGIDATEYNEMLKGRISRKEMAHATVQ